MSSAKVLGSISVDDLFAPTTRTKPEGYHYISEVAERVGLSVAHVTKRLKAEFDAGNIERVLVHSSVGSPRVAYRVEM